jgi:hypothetical protein
MPQPPKNPKPGPKPKPPKNPGDIDPAIKQVDPQTLLLGEHRTVRGIDSSVKEITLQGEEWEAALGTSLTDAQLTRAIDAASTVNLTVHDAGDKLLLSPMLFEPHDIELDGLWFRFVQTTKDDPFELGMNYEALPVAILREHKGPKKAFRDTYTRAEFVAALCSEAGVALWCPDLHVVQPIAGAGGGANAQQDPSKPNDPSGQAKPSQPSVGNSPAKAEPSPISNQSKSSGLVGSSNGERAYNFFIGKGLSPVCAAAILGSLAQESGGGDPTAINPNSIQPGTANGGIAGWNAGYLRSDYRGAGLSSDPEPQGTGGTGDLGGQLVVLWYEMNDNGIWHGSPFHLDTFKGITDLAQAVAYFVANWERAGIVGDRLTPARKALRMWGNGTPGAIGGNVAGSATKATRYAFEVKPDETYWDAMTRLAAEVDWRCFEANGIVFFVDDITLKEQRVQAVVTRDAEGVDWIGYDFDYGKPVSRLTVACRTKTWAAPPGTLIEVQEEGIVDGQYLVSEIDTPLMSPGTDVRTADVTAVRPTPPKPEPAAQTASGGTGGGNVPSGGTGKGQDLVDWARGQIPHTDATSGVYGCGGGPWCGCFVATGLERACGIKVPFAGGWAPNYCCQGWGTKIPSIAQAQPGDICTWKWSGPCGCPCSATDPCRPDHVNIYMGNRHWIGGNQSDAVTIWSDSSVNVGDLVAITRPPGF